MNLLFSHNCLHLATIFKITYLYFFLFVDLLNQFQLICFFWPFFSVSREAIIIHGSVIHFISLVQLRYSGLIKPRINQRNCHGLYYFHSFCPLHFHHLPPSSQQIPSPVDSRKATKTNGNPRQSILLRRILDPWDRPGSRSPRMSPSRQKLLPRTT